MGTTAGGLAVLKVIRLFAVERIKLYLKARVLLPSLLGRVVAILRRGVISLLQVCAHDDRLAVAASFFGLI